MARQPPPTTTCRSDLASGAVEAWLRLGIADRFEATLAEPVPPELVLLVARLFQ